MGDDIRDLRDTIVPKSNQLNADDLLGGPITVRVTAVRRGERDQPVAVHIDGGHQPFMPSKSMRRVLIAAWGKDGSAWVGRSMTLYRDPEVVFGGVRVGGIRISHLSHMDERLVLPLMVTRGQRKPYTVEPMDDSPQDAAPGIDRAAILRSLRDESVRASAALAVEMLGLKGIPPVKWTDEQIVAVRDAVFAPTREPGAEED